MATNGTDPEFLTRQLRAVSALLTTRNVPESAKVAHVGGRTLHRWLAEKNFRQAVLDAEGAAIDQVARRLIGMQDNAIDTLSGVLNDARTPAAVRLRAAQSGLDYLLRLRELRNAEQRLADLEVAVYGKNQKAY